MRGREAAERNEWKAEFLEATLNLFICYLMSTNLFILAVFIFSSEHDMTSYVPRPSSRFAIFDEIEAITYYVLLLIVTYTVKSALLQPLSLGRKLNQPKMLQ